MNSLEIRELQQKIINALNDAPLPLEAKRMMMVEIMGQINEAAAQEINMLMKRRTAEEKKRKDKAGAEPQCTSDDFDESEINKAYEKEKSIQEMNDTMAEEMKKEEGGESE